MDAFLSSPWFEKLFSWGAKRSLNDVDFDAKYAVEDGVLYCPKHGAAVDASEPRR